MWYVMSSVLLVSFSFTLSSLISKYGELTSLAACFWADPILLVVFELFLLNTYHPTSPSSPTTTIIKINSSAPKPDWLFLSLFIRHKHKLNLSFWQQKSTSLKVLMLGGGGRNWTYDQSVMRTTTAFDASFEFVVRTVSLSAKRRILAVQSLHLSIRRRTWLGIAFLYGFPEFDKLCTTSYPVGSPFSFWHIQHII